MFAEITFQKISRPDAVKLVTALRLARAELRLLNTHDNYIFVGNGTTIIVVKRKREGQGFIYRLCDKISVYYEPE